MYFSEEPRLVDRLIDHRENVAALRADLLNTSTEDKLFLEICDNLARELLLFPVSHSEAQCTGDRNLESEHL